ncbi:TIR-NBS-LRR resistance protein, partial [Trifolium medium]|nr:TIR-NBS-LRR resistance protein [Trifolium medium]
SKRVNRQGGFSAGGPSRPSNRNHGRQGNRPYNRPQNNRGSSRSGNQGTRGNQVREEQACYRFGEEGHYANECGNPGAAITCYNCQKSGHYARDCKDPRVEPAATAPRGGRPTARGRVYCMGTEVSGQASNAIQEDCQIA